MPPLMVGVYLWWMHLIFFNTLNRTAMLLQVCMLWPHCARSFQFISRLIFVDCEFPLNLCTVKKV